MDRECSGMSCERIICCGICENKFTCAKACKTCVSSHVTAATESNTDTHAEDSSDED